MTTSDKIAGNIMRPPKAPSCYLSVSESYFPARSGLMQRVESGPLIPPFAAADPVILINLVDLPAGTLGDLPQLAATYCGEPNVRSFLKRVGSEYPQPRVQ